MRSPAGEFADPGTASCRGAKPAAPRTSASPQATAVTKAFLGQALTPIVLSEVHLGRSVHFEVPQGGVFDGISSGETMEGTFRDATGGDRSGSRSSSTGTTRARSLSGADLPQACRYQVMYRWSYSGGYGPGCSSTHGPGHPASA